MTIVKSEKPKEVNNKSLYDYIIVAKYKDDDNIHHLVVFRDIGLSNQSIYDFKISYPLPAFYGTYGIGNHVTIKYDTQNMLIIEMQEY